MSIKVMTRVWELSPSAGSKRLVLLALADNANDDGYCWPSLETIAKKCRLHKRYVINLIKELESEGEIEKQKRTKDGKYTSTMYRVIVNPGSLSNEPVVNPSSPGSEAGDTMGSEPECTRVVNPASLKPSFNHQLKPSNNLVSAAFSGNGRFKQDDEISETPIPESNFTLEHLWRAICSQLQRDMPKPAFDDFILPCYPMAYLPESNTFQIATPTAHIRDWCTGRLASTIRRLCDGILNRETRVEFIVPEVDHVTVT